MKKSVESLIVRDKKILVRVDFNVPIQNGTISDDTRIIESLPTLRYLLERGGAIILCSHLGRPKGTVTLKYSLQPVAKKLEELLGTTVLFAKDSIGEETKRIARGLKPKEVLLLENLRFHPEEEKNEESFAKELAQLADYFVQDAFGAVHRAHASTSAITKFIPATAGFLIQREMNALEKVLKNPERPFVAILGGAKVSDKIGVIENLRSKVDSIFIGGAMAYTFSKSQGFSIGNSLVEENKIELARQLLSNGKKFFLPVDHLVVDKIDSWSFINTTTDQNIPENRIGVDIGPQSIEVLKSVIQNAKTVFWNGPMGIFETREFASGTLECARILAETTKRSAYTVVGGGDSIAALKQSGLSSSISHISTGGGASLEFLEGKKLPGIEALPDA